MNLKDIKSRLKKVNPFMVFEFKGVEDVLTHNGKADGLPLRVQTTPPSVSWLLSSGHVTSLILRYSESYQKIAGDGKTDPRDNLKGQPKLAQEIITEIADKVAGTEEERMKQITLIVQLAKDYLVNKAQYGWYGDNDEEKFRLQFTMDKEEADSINEESSERLAIWIDTVEDMELVAVASEMINAMPAETTVPNIPIKDTVIEESGELKEAVIDSVPADKVARFPRDTRSITVEDVR